MYTWGMANLFVRFGGSTFVKYGSGSDACRQVRISSAVHPGIAGCISHYSENEYNLSLYRMAPYRHEWLIRRENVK